MAFSIKTWVDRLSEFPNRRRLDSTGIANTYDVTRAEGNVSVEGDKINAANLNDLESRISEAFNETVDKSTSATSTLLTSGWTGSEAPYSITVSVTGAKSEPTRIEVQPTTDATAAQWAAWRAAFIRGGGQGTDSLTLLADGDKPEIDIPIAVTIRGDVS
ncbi:hypothetical protein [Caproiciproducens faecalis]|uniref:Uncharacterized protein n=1 Tax=Caproiciproducens faecalis TaxID=2820301 RepID=A0ABS7DRJ8_9FIRM|nr:hypothetical protein [Caproiciproducens faecalis]MBW7573924.1 hypothetical protein [Caproiciproducens faecalis]